MEFLPLVREEFIDMYFMIVWTKGNHWERRKVFQSNSRSNSLVGSIQDNNNNKKQKIMYV